MTWSAVGGWNNSTSSTFTLTPSAAGNLIVLLAENPSATVWATGVSSTNASWAQAGSTFTGTTNARSINAWLGTALSTTGATVTVTWNGTPGTLHVVWLEAHSTAGSWLFDTLGHWDVASGSSFAGPAPAGSNELYVGYGVDSGSAAAGSTSGFVYNANADGSGNGGCYNLAYSSASAPVWADSGQVFGFAVAIREAAAAAPPVQPVQRHRLRNQRSRRQVPQQVPAAPDTAAPALADAAGAAESLSVTVDTPLFEVAAAGDRISVSGGGPASVFTGLLGLSSVPAVSPAFPEAAGAAEALSVAVSEPSSDVAGAADSISVAVSVPLPDVAGAAETQAIAVTLADAAGAAEQLSVQVSVPLADTGAARDSVLPAAAVPLTEAAGAAEASVVTATVPLPEAGGAADAVTIAAALALPDAGAAAESQVSGVPVSVADAAGAAEVASVSAAVPLAEAAGAADAITVQVTLALAEVAAAAEAAVSGVPIGLAEAAGGTEALSASATVPLAEAAGAAEQLAVAAAGQAADAAAAADSIAVVRNLPSADVAGAAEALSVTVSVPLSESAGAADHSGTVVSLGLSEAAGAADAVMVVIGTHPTGTVTWNARADAARWQAEGADARWAAQAGEARWNASPELARWSTQPEPARWRIVMATFDPIAADSLEEVNIRWTSDLDGTTVDPTVSPLTVQHGFAPSSGNPLAPNHPSTWYAASWLAGGTGKGYVSQSLTGPGGVVTLTAGQKYDVWGYIQGTPESPRKFAGVLTVY